MREETYKFLTTEIPKIEKFLGCGYDHVVPASTRDISVLLMALVEMCGQIIDRLDYPKETKDA